MWGNVGKVFYVVVTQGGADVIADFVKHIEQNAFNGSRNTQAAGFTTFLHEQVWNGHTGTYRVGEQSFVSQRLFMWLT